MWKPLFFRKKGERKKEKQHKMRLLRRVAFKNSLGSSGRTSASLIKC
jgi:hypothetical protein